MNANPPIAVPLVLFALEREAAPFRRVAGTVRIRVSGVGRENARRAVVEAIQESTPSRVIAAGFCGALVPDSKVGDIVTSPHIATVDRLVWDPAEKIRLAERTGARAVDMESEAIATACAEHGLAFTAIRAVSDASDTRLSPELVRLLSGGEVSVMRAIAALIRRPRLFREFLRLARDTKLAARNLAMALERELANPQAGRVTAVPIENVS